MTADTLERLELRLVTLGVYTEELTAGDDRIVLEYESIQPGTDVVAREAGEIVNVFREFFEEDLDPATIEATVYDEDGTRRGTWRADREWIEALEAGELSEVEFSQRVIDSIESG